MNQFLQAYFGLWGGADVWEMVTHLEGVASAPCLIDLRLNHRVFVRKLEVIDDLRGAP
jgi:hypothetical protein